MLTSASPSRVRLGKLIRFLGRRVVACGLIRIILSFALFGAEMAFGYGLIQFFERLQTGVSSAGFRWEWLRTLTFAQFIGAFALVVISRGVIEWSDTFFAREMAEAFRNRQRLRLTQWLFHGRVGDVGGFQHLYSTQVEWSIACMASTMTLLKSSALAIPLFSVLFWLSPKLTLTLLGVILIFGLPLRRLNGYSSRLGVRQNERALAVHRRLTMIARNLLLLRIHGMSDQESEWATHKLDEAYHVTRGHAMVTATLSSYLYVVGATMLVVIGIIGKNLRPEMIGFLIPYLYLLHRALNLSLGSVANLPTIKYYGSAFIGLSRWWAEHAHDGVRGVDAYQRPSKPCFSAITEPLGWKLEKVSFSYEGRQEPVLENFSLDIPGGSIVVFVGESGAGKSTLLGLLIGEVTATSGTIYVAHGNQAHPIGNCHYEVLPNVGYVGAESFLIGGTLRENLTYGFKEMPTDEEMWQAIRQAQCQFINELSEGLNHRITDQGEGLSAGQKQRLCLARALLRRPKVLLLDEATANLDEVTEANLIATLSALKGKLTIVAATHRLAFKQIADQVVDLSASEKNLRVAALS